uniref:Transmembrane protein n=1 Tax=Heterorhabditis bacteriophora TaxID=37862 RepID=A0A1I7X695_HETBA
MAEVKKLLHPKVAVPMVGLLVLIIVGTLVAVFYIRNPTITDGLFAHDNEVTNSPDNGGDMEHRVEAVTAGVSYPSYSNSSGVSGSKSSSASNYFNGSTHNSSFSIKGFNPGNSMNNRFKLQTNSLITLMLIYVCIYSSEISGATTTTAATTEATLTESGHSITAHAIEPVEHV